MLILIPMAGNGTRFSSAGYTKPKPLIDVAGESMISRVIKNFNSRECKIVLVACRNNIDERALMNEVSQFSNVEIVWTEYVPHGSAASCLMASRLIGEEELIIVNCDQIIEDFEWTSFRKFLDLYKPEALLGAFLSKSPKNSFIKTDDDGNVILVKEKQVISDTASNGFHYWRKGNYFIESCRKMIESSDTFNGEFYVAPSFNYLQEGLSKKVYYFNMHFPIGTPEDLKYYLSKFYAS